MPFTLNIRHRSELLEDLRLAFHGLSAPFTCGGTLVPEKSVTLCFPDNTQIPVLRAKDASEQVQLLQPLVNRCARAPFGKGRTTSYDRIVRDALQIKAEGGAFSVLHFDPAESGILEQVRREMMPQAPGPLRAELYNLNIYQDGGHFVAHKDTPRGGDMMGTLVVCLPSRFSNGSLVVKHHGVFRTYEWDDAINEQSEPARIHWAAFFGDVDHEIARVWRGLRVTLTYLIRLGPGVEPETTPSRLRESKASLVQKKLRALLDDRAFLPKGGVLAFPCSHLYHRDARFQRDQQPLTPRTATALKGRDHNIAAAAMAEGLRVTLCPYMFETCAEEAWQLEHYPTSHERAALDDRMGPWELEEALAIRASSEDDPDFGLVWVDPPPHQNGATMYPELAEGRLPANDPDWPALMHLHSCEYSATGYFGNEGSDIDLYVYAALHVAIPPYGKGVRPATKVSSPRASASRKSKSRG